MCPAYQFLTLTFQWVIEGFFLKGWDLVGAEASIDIILNKTILQ
jgi:hypothetical protein